MAKSPVGGSRAYITGRIGSDVYSLGKDGKGKRQQVVRALAEQVANPRTHSQMFNRMVMSSVMQAVHAMNVIIDHSFDGLPTGQPSISEFIRRNYALAKADAIANPLSSPHFGMVKYGEKGARPGEYVISSGKLVKNNLIAGNNFRVIFNLSAGNSTVGGLRELLGISDDGYLTWLRLTPEKGLEYVRCYLDPSIADSTAITNDNKDALFTFVGNITPTVEFSGNQFMFKFEQPASCCSTGVILSDKIGGKWQHSACKMSIYGSITYTANTAIATYPVGDEMFLNGGEI